MDKDWPWSFFNGASQETSQLCDSGFVIFLSKTHYFMGKANIERGSNNYSKLMALLLLIKSALNKNLVCLQIYGGSMFVINWMNGALQFKVNSY